MRLSSGVTEIHDKKKELKCKLDIVTMFDALNLWTANIIPNINFNDNGQWLINCSITYLFKYDREFQNMNKIRNYIICLNIQLAAVIA